MSHTHLLYPNGSDPCDQPTYKTNFGARPAPAANGYPGYNYGPPPPVPNYNHGYYNSNHPLVQSAPPAHAAYQFQGYNNSYAPQPQPLPQPPPSNYGCYPTPQPVGRRYKAKNGRKGGTSSIPSESYTVSGNRISGNEGDHHGVFNIGNKHGRRDIDDEEDED